MLEQEEVIQYEQGDGKENENIVGKTREKLRHLGESIRNKVMGLKSDDQVMMSETKFLEHLPQISNNIKPVGLYCPKLFKPI